MAESAYDVLGIGNAIVDVLAHTDDDFLIKHDLAKGSMALVDEARAQLIYDSMGSAREISGGSAANTIAGIASLGGCGVYIGKVKADQLGAVFRHDIRATGVAFDTEPASEGPQTARSFILITPDAQRTMNTYLGAGGGGGISWAHEDVTVFLDANAKGQSSLNPLFLATGGQGRGGDAGDHTNWPQDYSSPKAGGDGSIYLHAPNP